MLKLRAMSFLADYLIMIGIGCLIMFLTSDLIITMLLIYPAAINKDFLNGKSIGKRIFGIQVQNLQSNKASEWKGALRNILPIIPIDLLYTILNPKRRIGDYIAGTQIGYNNKFTLRTIGSELKNYRLNKKIIFGLIFGMLNISLILELYAMILPL